MTVFQSKHGYFRLGLASLLLGLTAVHWPQVLLAQAFAHTKKPGAFLCLTS
jgi:hypothetical protein